VFSRDYFLQIKYLVKFNFALYFKEILLTCVKKSGYMCDKSLNSDTGCKQMRVQSGVGMEVR